MSNNPLEAVPVTVGTAKHARETRVFQGIPSFTISPKGRFFCCWYSGDKGEGPQNFVTVAVSDDKGATWRESVGVVDPPGDNVRAFDAAMWTDPLGRVHLFWAQSLSPETWKIADGVNGVWDSYLEEPDAEELKWSPSRRVADGIMLNKPIVAPEGTWMYPVSIWGDSVGSGTVPEWNKPFIGANLFTSTDNGNTLQRRGVCRFEHNTFDEHHYVPLHDGRLWCLSRTEYGIGQAFSKDGGVTWEDNGPSAIPGPCSRFFIRRLPSGRLLLVNHKIPLSNKPDFRPRINMAAFLSDDDGKTWSDGLLIDERKDVSYPDACLDSDGKIWCVYDRDRLKAGEILLVGITEDEILAGGALPPERRIVISHLDPH